MYFVGIAISKFKHDCIIIDELGDIVTPSCSFSNDPEGFSLFKELLDSLEGEKKIGLKAIGHYRDTLKLFLKSNGFTFLQGEVFCHSSVYPCALPNTGANRQYERTLV